MINKIINFLKVKKTYPITMVVVKDVIGMMESFLSLFLNFFHLSLQLIRFSDVEVVDCTEVLIKFIYERN